MYMHLFASVYNLLEFWGKNYEPRRQEYGKMHIKMATDIIFIVFFCYNININPNGANDKVFIR